MVSLTQCEDVEVRLLAGIREVGPLYVKSCLASVTPPNCKRIWLTSMIQSKNSETASHHMSIETCQHRHKSPATRMRIHTKRQLPARVSHQVPAPDRDARLGWPVPVCVVVDLVILAVALVDTERLRLIHVRRANTARSLLVGVGMRQRGAQYLMAIGYIAMYIMTTDRTLCRRNQSRSQ